MNISSVIISLLLICSTAYAREPDAGWGEVFTPKKGMPRVYGEYSAGCIQGAEALPISGTGYEVMRSERHRYFGHPSLIAYLRSLAKELHKSGEVLFIGDMGQPRGGPMISGHSSHQTGLDADIWFGAIGMKDITVPLSEAVKQNLRPIELADPMKNKLDETLWNSDYVQFFKKAAAHKAVERIFVHPTIKRKLCETERGKGWLYKIRPWWWHHDHLHVRLKCPAGDRNCVPQAPVSHADDCGGALAWWFSIEAREEFQKRLDRMKEKHPRIPPVLPTACASVLE